MKAAQNATRERRPAGGARRPCREYVRIVDAVPPACCGPLSAPVARRPLERRTAPAVRAAARRSRARTHATLEDDLLAAAIALAERRAQVLACGLACLELDIGRAREVAARKPRPLRLLPGRAPGRQGTPRGVVVRALARRA